MENFEDSGLKNGTYSCFNKYMKFVSRRGQGHCLTFDPGLTII